jgi:hypothetical protein
MLATLLLIPAAFAAQDPIQELRAEVERLRREYEERIQELEARIELLQAQVENPPPPPPPAQQENPNVFNPRVTVFGNMTYRADSRTVRNDDGDRVDNRFSLRETEVDFRAAIDPYAEGVLITTLEEESPGEFHVGVEEGYAIIKRLPLPGLEGPPLGLLLKAGRFRPQFGRANVLHTHDLPQTTRPWVLREFLGEEGAIGDGMSAGVWLPMEWLDEQSSFRLTAEAFSGELATSNERRLQGLLNLTWSRPLGADHRVELSGIWHAGETHSDFGTDPVRTWSLDLLYQWRPLSQATYRGFVLGGQIFWGDRRFVDDLGTAHSRAPFGWYAFAQYQFNRMLFAGVRYDRTESIAIPDADLRSIFPYVSWYPSEFLRVRFGYEHTWFDDALADSDLGTWWIELNWVFGSHPPEPYWVHR